MVRRIFGFGKGSINYLMIVFDFQVVYCPGHFTWEIFFIILLGLCDDVLSEQYTAEYSTVELLLGTS